MGCGSSSAVVRPAAYLDCKHKGNTASSNLVTNMKGANHLTRQKPAHNTGTLRSAVKPGHSNGALSLRSAVLSRVLEFLSIPDIDSSQTVCTKWRLTEQAMNRIMRERYLRDFEPDTAASSQIAVEGSETPWWIRYKRRMLTEQNWKLGRFRATLLTWENSPVKMHQRGDELFVDCCPGPLYLLDISTNAVIKEYRPLIDRGPVMASHGDLVFAACGSRGLIKAWQLPDMISKIEYKGHTDSVTHVQTDGKLLVSGSEDYTVRIWRVETGELLHTLTHDNGIVSLACDFENDVLFCCRALAQLNQWQISTGTRLMQIENGGRYMTFDANRSQLVTGVKSTLHFYQTSEHKRSAVPVVATGMRVFSCRPLACNGTRLLLVSGIPDPADELTQHLHWKTYPSFHVLELGDFTMSPLSSLQISFRRDVVMTPLTIFAASGESLCICDFTPKLLVGGNNTMATTQAEDSVSTSRSVFPKHQHLRTIESVLGLPGQPDNDDHKT